MEPSEEHITPVAEQIIWLTELATTQHIFFELEQIEQLLPAATEIYGSLVVLMDP